MIEIKPMDEGYLHLTCLHAGPIDTATFEPKNDHPLAGGHPPHPWSDEELRRVAGAYREHSIGHPRPAAFMREMTRRYGSCAMLAWEAHKVVGHLRFYPMCVARQLWQPDPCPILDSTLACEPEQDEGTLWVQCVMTSRPYLGPEPDTVTGHHFPPMAEAGAGKGVGLKLVQGLIAWAREHGWKRIVKVAHADLDCFYGQLGGGGKAFWEKAGFKVVGSFYKLPYPPGDFLAVVQAQAAEKGMAEQEPWTWYRMMYEL